MEEGKVTFVRMLLHDGDDTVHIEYYGDEAVITRMLVNALAQHLFDTLSEEADNNSLAEAVYHDILTRLNEFRPEK